MEREMERSMDQDMSRGMNGSLHRWTAAMRSMPEKIRKKAMKKEPGIDGIIVTVGLCIIALLLCVIMKDSLKTFIETIVGSLTSEAQKILTGVIP